MKRLTLDIKRRFYKDYSLGSIDDKVPKRFVRSQAIRDWLLWSVFINRPEMAQCLCSYSQVSN